MIRTKTIAVLLCLMAWAASAPALDDRLRIEQEQQDALRDHCDGLLSGRLNASREGRWREVFRLAKSYSDACRGADDRFAISRAFEDMGWASMMLDDARTALVYLQQCLDANGFAGGCYARKAQVLLSMGRNREAEATAWRGLSSTERAIVIAKQEMASMKRPDLRADQYWRNRYLRKREELDGRISSLEEAKTLLQEINSYFD